MIKTIIILLLSFSIQGAFAQTPPPGIPADNELYKNGYLDVTLLGADPSGVNLSTDAIQKAVVLARDYHLVCFFPSGIYLVDDTIACLRKSVFQSNKWKNADHESVLVGSAKGRPVIRLKPGSALFQNAANPMPVFWFWAMSAWGQQPECEGTVAAPITDPACEQSNVNYHHLFKGIDIDLGGNPGAVGIRMAGAQGATIEDVKINANGAFAGIYNPPGQGGGTYNVEVEGGQYGFYIKRVNGRDQSKFQVFCGCTFRNQTNKVFQIDSGFPMVLVGFRIVKEYGSINTGLPAYGLSLIDGIIELGSGKVIDGTANNIYMKNVFVKGANTIANSFTISNPSGWTRIDEYSYCNSSSTNLIDGNLNKNTIQLKTENLDLDPVVLANELKNRHVWDESAFPHFELPGIVNVKDATQMNGNPAKGNGSSDDTEALKYAIANFDLIFLPKGTYIVSKTLTLRKNTKIFGAGRTYSLINHSATWNPVDGNSIMETVDDVEATTMLAFLGINIVNGHPPSDYYSPQHPLIWRAGRNSMVRSVSPGLNITVTGNGGGRWNATYNHKHQFYIDGTSQALSLYGFNPERAANPQVEIKNATNINMFYVKSETHTETNIYPQNAYATTIKMINSSDVAIFGSTGNVDLTDQMGMYEIENCTNIQINHVRPFKNAANWYSLKETKGSSLYTVPSATVLALYKRTTPVGLNEKPNVSDFQVYPNPCRDFIRIDMPQISKAISYQIEDINGRILQKGSIVPDQRTIPVNLASGLYILSIKGVQYTARKKFISE